MSTHEWLAIIAVGLILTVVAFQLGLALGLPLGEATMGGRAATVDGVLTPPYRLAALVSAALLLIAAGIVLARAGFVAPGLSDAFIVVGAWVVVAFMVVNTLTNLTGRHPLERWGMSAITFTVAILTAYVALATPT